MRGEVHHYDEGQGVGYIVGTDGKRYVFERSDLRRLVPITKGTQVEFQVDAASAREIFVVNGAASAAPPTPFGRAGVAPAPVLSTGLWAFFVRTLTTNYANFSGRARRKEYWGFYLFWCIAALAAVFIGLAIDNAIGNLDDYSGVPVVMILAGVLFVLATFIPTIAVTVRRIHDIGLSGWFYLLILVPSVGGLIIFVFTLIPSQDYENKWGPVPA